MPALARIAQPKTTERTLTLTTTRQLRAQENGARVILNSSTAFTTTLPPAQVGLYFTFFVKVVAAATGHDIAVLGTSKVFGKSSPTGTALAGTSGKGRRNTQATATVGDGLFVWSDGTDWYADPAGTWAEMP